MDDQTEKTAAGGIGLGTWIRALASGAFVAGGVVFVGVMLPFAFGQVPLGIALFWPSLLVSAVVGALLGIRTSRQILRRAV